MGVQKWDKFDHCQCGDWTEKEVERQGWILVDKGSKVNRKSDQFYLELSNAYSNLADFLANLSPDDKPTSVASLFKLKATKRQHQRIQRKIKKKLNNTTDTEDALIKQYIGMAEDKRTEMAKRDTSNVHRVRVDAVHLTPTKSKPSILQQSKNLGRLVSASTRRLIQKRSLDRPWWQNKMMRMQQYWSQITPGQMVITSVKRTDTN